MCNIYNINCINNKLFHKYEIDETILLFALKGFRKIPEDGIDWVREPDVAATFLERLCMFAAMSIAAIATHRLSSKVHEQKREPFLDEPLFYLVGQLLRGQEFSLGYAKGILSTKIEMTNDLIDRSSTGSGQLDHVLDELIRLSHIGEHFSNFSRYASKISLEKIANDLFEALPVLGKIKISNRQLVVNDSIIEPFPFIYISRGINNANTVSLLHKYMPNADRIMFNGRVLEIFPLEKREHFDVIKTIYHLKSPPKPPSIYRTAKITKLEPVTRFADALIEGVRDPDRRAHLWVIPALGENEKKSFEIAEKGGVRLKSCLVKLCLETDPLHVSEKCLMSLLDSEIFPLKKLEKLLIAVHKYDNYNSEEDVEKEQRKIEELTKDCIIKEELRNRLLKKIALLPSIAGISNDLKVEQASYYAKYIVERFGFTIEDIPRVRGLIDYYHPAALFKKYLTSCTENNVKFNLTTSIESANKIHNTIEELFRRLNGFYTCMKYWDIHSPSGVRSNKSCFEDLCKIKDAGGLSGLIRIWSNLIKDKELQEKTNGYLGFKLDNLNSLESGCECSMESNKIWEYVGQLTGIRNCEAHGTEITITNENTNGIVNYLLSAVENYIELLNMLQGSIDGQRIFPYVVSLKQILTNKCHIRSHIYELIKEETPTSASASQTISLITPQPVFSDSNHVGNGDGPNVNFYAFPRKDDEFPDVWSEPVLISVRFVEKEISK